MYEELNTLYYSLGIRFLISSVIRLVGHVARMGMMMTEYTVFVTKCERKKAQWIPRNIRGNNRSTNKEPVAVSTEKVDRSTLDTDPAIIRCIIIITTTTYCNWAFTRWQ